MIFVGWNFCGGHKMSPSQSDYLSTANQKPNNECISANTNQDKMMSAPLSLHLGRERCQNRYATANMKSATEAHNSPPTSGDHTQINKDGHIFSIVSIIVMGTGLMSISQQRIFPSHSHLIGGDRSLNTIVM